MPEPEPKPMVPTRHATTEKMVGRYSCHGNAATMGQGPGLVPGCNAYADCGVHVGDVGDDMEFWLVGAALVVVVVVGFAIIRRQRSAARAGKHPVELYVTRPYRVSWPPGYADDRPVRRVKKPDAVYLIEAFDSRAAALEFLRGCEVRDERVYVIAESPQGNLGKDLIMIFEEEDGAFVEIAERSALSAPEFSRENCSRCGYSVIPAASPFEGFSSDEPGVVTLILDLQSMEQSGQGYQCTSCDGLACARCYQVTPHTRAPDGSLDLRCWLCGNEVDLFTE